MSRATIPSLDDGLADDPRPALEHEGLEVSYEIPAQGWEQDHAAAPDVVIVDWRDAVPAQKMAHSAARPASLVEGHVGFLCLGTRCENARGRPSLQEFGQFPWWKAILDFRLGTRRANTRCRPSLRGLQEFPWWKATLEFRLGTRRAIARCRPSLQGFGTR